MNPLISVVIPNWNGKHLLETCLSSLERLKYPNYEVVVVDNGSSDQSVEYIKSEYPKVNIIELSTNTGFAYAVNRGIENSKGEYIALLNNDTEVTPEWLDEIIKPFSYSDSIGIVASKLLNFYHRDIIDSAGDFLNIVGQGYAIGGGCKDGLQWNEGRYIFSGTGGASIYKREIFDKVGLLEEIFFMYFEDMDLAYRAQRAGFTAWYQPSAIVYHIQKASSKRSKDLLEYLLYRNFVINYLINTPTSLFFKRLSLLKFCLVFVHTFFYQAMHGYLKSAAKTWWWLGSNVQKIYEMRRARSKMANPLISDEYIDSFLADKKLKVLFFRF